MTATYSKIADLLDTASAAVDQARTRHRKGALAGHRLLRTLDPDELQRFVEAGQWLVAEPGDVIASQGRAVEAVTFIGEGTAREEVASAGKGTYRAVVGFIGPGEDVGLLSAIDGGPHSSSAIAMQRLQALQVPIRAVERFLDSHPEWYQSIAEVAVSRLRAHGLWLQALV